MTNYTGSIYLQGTSECIERCSGQQCDWNTEEPQLSSQNCESPVAGMSEATLVV